MLVQLSNVTFLLNQAISVDPSKETNPYIKDLVHTQCEMRVS